MNSILAKKVEQSQKFLENGQRIPVTKLDVNGNTVVAIKTLDKDHYSAVQLGFDKRTKKLSPKNAKSAYKFLKEVRMTEQDVAPAVGAVIKASEVFKPGDIINVTGISKGKGFAGGVKRYGFHGGPRTHGQSDRERAPGSIGTSTTPGRVLKGKRMAGRMGQDKVTVRNVKIISVADDYILIKGLVPGGRNNLLMLKKVGADKKFVPLYDEEAKKEVKEQDAEKAKIEEKKVDSAKQDEKETETITEVENKEEKAEEAPEAKMEETPIVSDAKSDEKQNTEAAVAQAPEAKTAPTQDSGEKKEEKVEEPANEAKAETEKETEETKEDKK